ncbi:SDR family oxidoreductase [Bacillus pseudomycoides]|uniref:SDR family oxidoreductase n=1 Tax=Bacillus pseudomycoides TaxID=64104 RepID=UPI0030003155
MKIFIIGANGQIGRYLVQLLKATPHHVKVMVRKQEQVANMQDLGADEVVIGDLEGNFSHLIEGSDVVIFTAGSGGDTGVDKTITVDFNGAWKTIEAAEAYKIPRFILVSSLLADRPQQGPDDLYEYLIVKGRVDEWLRKSTLNYTIWRPGALIDTPSTGKVSIAEHLEEPGRIPRIDVAYTIVEALEAENTFYRSFDLITGTTPIKEAIQSL